MLTLNDGRNELWQWDTGRKLTVDADCSQVHFSNKVFGRSTDVDVVDGVAVIPDILLQTDKDLNVWAFVGTAENGYTKISKVFKVNRRNKPADYVFTPPEQTTLAEIMERLEDLEAIQDPDAIKNAVEDYLEQNPVEAPVQSVNGKTGKVELSAEDVGAISQDDLQEATNKALAQAKESGEFDGKDGATFTPSLDDEGNLSWSNDKGLPNPETKNIRGPQGPAGEVSDDKIAEAVKEYMDENPAAGSGALTSAQIDALHGMFKVCAYDDSKDVSGAYAAFLTAFNITDSGGGEEEPDTPEKTLTSISATYSGGDVAVGTAVADLTGIVVTAHYSDGSSETVTGYTLSGTIAEGSNTVTVSYGGKTAIFTVTGVAESGGETDEVKMLNMVNKGDGTKTSAFYEGDADSTQLTAWNGNWYKSNAVADEDTVVNIAFAAGSNNANLFYYAAQIKQEDYKKFYYVEQLGTAMTTETVKSYTVRAGYELVFLAGNSSEIAKLNVTYTDGDFTAPSELYTNLVDGFTLDAYLNSSDGSVTANWSQQNTSDMIDISGIPSVYIWHIAQGNVLEQSALTCCFYDTAEKYISGGNSPANTDAIAPVAVPENAKYMRVGESRNNTEGGVYVGVNPAPYRYELVAFK